MTEEAHERGKLLDALHSSKGMEHRNRSHQREFSLNIFVMNSQELSEITSRVNDPDEGLRLMSVANREAGEQMHREVARRLHNFVASALMLVDHTRSFIRRHYDGTLISNRYQERVSSEFARDPLAQFVQNLRNYMLHSGLPPSEMYLNLEAIPGAPGGATFTAGIRIRAPQLAVWDNWSSPARSFIERAGEFIDIRSFSEAYTEKVVSLHRWLHAELDQHHREDLDELLALHVAVNRDLHVEAPAQSGESQDLPQRDADSSLDDFVFVSAHAAEIDRISIGALAKIREVDLPRLRVERFVSERPIGATITDKDMIEPPLFWGEDVAGRRVFIFVYDGNRAFGMEIDDYSMVQTIVEEVFKAGWAKRFLSRSFVESIVIKWMRFAFVQVGELSLSEALASECKGAVEPLALWAPVAHLEVETAFEFGPVEVKTITAAMIDVLETEAVASSPLQKENISLLFQDIRKKMQGLAAVVLRMQGEAEKVKEEGAAVAEMVVALLRLFSPAATSFPMMCASALLGSEIVPRSNLLVLGEGTFNYTQATLSPGRPDWLISDETLSKLRPRIKAVGALVRPDGLSAFALRVRSSLILFGKGATFFDVVERLSYTLSSVEAFLLRHSAEPVEFNVAERMGLLLTEVRAEREEIRRNVWEAYRLRARQDIAPLNEREMNSVAMFLHSAHAVINISVDNLDRFEAVADFLNSVDHLRDPIDLPDDN